jgi:hypothetical protein
MTTLIGKKSNWKLSMYWDTRCTWGYHWLNDWVIKIQKLFYRNSEILIWTTWDYLHKDILLSLYHKYLKTFKEEYLLENDIFDNIIWAKDFAEYIKANSWIKDIDIWFMILHKNYQIIVWWNWCIEESTWDDMIFMWSWSWYWKAIYRWIKLYDWWIFSIQWYYDVISWLDNMTNNIFTNVEIDG